MTRVQAAAESRPLAAVQLDRSWVIPANPGFAMPAKISVAAKSVDERDIVAS
jgi:hypothetical protein